MRYIKLVSAVPNKIQLHALYSFSIEQMLTELLDTMKLYKRNTKSIYTSFSGTVIQSNKQHMRWMHDLNISGSTICLGKHFVNCYLSTNETELTFLQIKRNMKGIVTNI